MVFWEMETKTATQSEVTSDLSTFLSVPAQVRREMAQDGGRRLARILRDMRRRDELDRLAALWSC